MTAARVAHCGFERVMETQTPQPIWSFLAGLQELDLRIWHEEERLRVSAPPGVLTPQLRAELSARKAEILDFLAAIRIAEEWALVDNLSHGRVAVAFATGFRHVDFMLSPDKFGARAKLTIHTVERLAAIGIDEIACLIDFGIDYDTTMAGLQDLAGLFDLLKSARFLRPIGRRVWLKFS